jgi:hypothetical protein
MDSAARRRRRPIEEFETVDKFDVATFPPSPNDAGAEDVQ